ncbi:hypothetical protein RYX36_020642 [Vicia faba]
MQQLGPGEEETKKTRFSETWSERSTSENKNRVFSGGFPAVFRQRIRCSGVVSEAGDGGEREERESLEREKV